MSDNKKNIGTQDDIRIDSNDPSEVEYVHQKFPDLSHDEIKKAIEEFGPMRQDVMNRLNEGKRS